MKIREKGGKRIDYLSTETGNGQRRREGEERGGEREGFIGVRFSSARKSST